MAFDAAVQREPADIHSYLEQQSVGLGDRLVTQFRHPIEFMLRFPNACALIGPEHRRCRVSPFRYGIVYRVDEKLDEILVTSIIHLESDPKSWRLD